ncbi:MAG: family 20 glycosylhydrolase, partial [Terrimesophilobacter sp.]
MTIPQTAVIPAPVFQSNGDGCFTLSPASAIEAYADAAPVGEYLATLLRPVTRLALPLVGAHDGGDGDIALAIAPGHPGQGYELEVTESGIRLTASEAAGLFAGVQTLRQLLPPLTSTTTKWRIPATHITDHPRFAYRGAMLDVARNFFGVEDIKRFLDLIALLKLNVLHLHLTDDQGWRIQIEAWPRL